MATEDRPTRSRSRRPLLPSKTGSDEQVCFPAAIPQNLDMSDLHGPRDQHNGLIEKTVQIGGFTRGPAEIDQDPHVPPDFQQFQRLLTGRGSVHHGPTLASRIGAKGKCLPLPKQDGATPRQ